jgi:holo-[acyl-carrier protein] synthase
VIIGLGTDIIEVERVAEKIRKNNGFAGKIFSAEEIRLCEASTNRYQNYAGRFAAKEAFLKATGQGLNLTHDLCLIEVLPDPSGKPFIKLNGILEQYQRERNWKNIHVSISHIKEAATAVVIIES